MFIMCLGIFLARIVDVSLGTLRTVYSVKGKTLIAAIISFVEIIIWYLVARQALNTEINSFLIPLSYAGGYATGTFLGTFISNSYVKGHICVQVITKTKQNDNLINNIRKKGYGISIISLRNIYDKEEKEMLLIEINKSSLKELINIIKNDDDEAFIMVNDTKFVQNGLIK